MYLTLREEGFLVKIKHMNKKFYITTAIDYSNDVIHVGHSYQKLLADVLARYHRLIGDETYFLTGTDEHGQKVEKSATEKGIEPKEFVDKIAEEDKREWKSLDISYDRFIRTTDEDHIKFAQEFYLKSKAAGDIYLSKYEGLYCEGCEAYLEESDLVDGKCPFHPNKEPQKLIEENYFFRLSKYQKFIEELLENNPSFVFPDSKRREILSFVKSGLRDFSVSRKNVKWGIPVPDDPEHTVYVWFDALINYLTFGVEKNCWPADIHVLGKDNQRFHAIFWPAMLKSAGYELPKTILVHDFFSLNGQKISKSLGNVIRPSELVAKFGADGVRYFFLRHGPLLGDVDITWNKLAEVYNADLANGLGNLVARVAKLCERTSAQYSVLSAQDKFSKEISKQLDNFRFDEALKIIWGWISKTDKKIEEVKPWVLEGEKLKEALKPWVAEIRKIATSLQPFLPGTAEKILGQFKGPKIGSSAPLFPRIK
ncbi:MAG: Methionyl-tRNA synthetase [Candidatus Amesbacteria bacterium GW2011_GWA2_47_11]|uniref:Methionine--tRNA ligase n=2 Tax=Candidatus Amesiibacteriota TaxID=1752730 RepID=A0A0G1RHR8_9BACT|nr:MAG: Methionyl-tRNA synthetase [Candidatus Amesbacteria bacterium GW2011_GWA2_47_11]KKW00839.1 MAG: Methionyl-tRNA synthetase [Candidatus Amesbacteria bacterium GW2011_GWA1_48_9]